MLGKFRYKWVKSLNFTAKKFSSQIFQYRKFDIYGKLPLMAIRDILEQRFCLIRDFDKPVFIKTGPECISII